MTVGIIVAAGFVVIMFFVCMTLFGLALEDGLKRYVEKPLNDANFTLRLIYDTLREQRGQGPTSTAGTPFR
jgi:hypothetical protein